MRSITAASLLIVVAWAKARIMAVPRNSDGKFNDTFVDRMQDTAADMLVDKMLDRMQYAAPITHFDLDSTTLEKRGRLQTDGNPRLLFRPHGVSAASYHPSPRGNQHHLDGMANIDHLTQALTRIPVQIRSDGRYLFPRAHATTQMIEKEDVETKLRVPRTKSAPNPRLTAYQILHPYLFSSQHSGADIARPLAAVIDILRETLQTVGKIDMNLVLEHKDTKILRIEHGISHTVDPLCWLHAQTRAGQHLRQPIVYFSNADRAVDVAAYGAAYLHRGAADDELWKLIASLPPSSHVYGGERFDREMEPDHEWEQFGAGFWMLPLIELKRRAGAGPRLEAMTTSLSVHVVRGEHQSWIEAAHASLTVLQGISDAISEAAPPTTLPPVISRDVNYGRDLDGQEIYERGVTAALDKINSGNLEKVVLARRSKLFFDKNAKLSALDVLRKWKFGGNEGGHLFYLYPGGGTVQEFFGCSPEHLFRIAHAKVVTEALAGTRPRGSTQEEDAALSRDLVESIKDQSENDLTWRFISTQLDDANRLRLTRQNAKHEERNSKDSKDRYVVRRLLHLQHLCRHFERDVEQGVRACDVSRFLLHALHPTPAVCGYPVTEAKAFIRKAESIGFDRGFYAGPFGYIGGSDAEIVVAIRSGLITKHKQAGEQSTTLSVFAGAGIVPGSTVQGEWAECSLKLNVVSSLFPQSPISFSSAPTPNVAWSTAFIEELIRCGVTQFYVCPGSRSTPLVAALAKAMRSNVGVVEVFSVHDERGAAFRAAGHGRWSGRPAAVITSSGTATANLYPGIVEASTDGIPLLVITADRPYENRDAGANQAVDQVKMYSSTYVRWFRDIPPPSDDVPVSVVLSDADHAVQVAIQQRGPVHLNVQFRENLAPDAGSIRNDNRVESVIRFNGLRFTDVPNFFRWSNVGDQWTKIFADSGAKNGIRGDSVFEVASLIRDSKRGAIVVGNLRAQPGQDMDSLVETIAYFASVIGFPIFAGIQSGSLRARSSAVVRFAEHLLKTPSVSQNLQPDLIIQIGHPLVSTEIAKVIQQSRKASESSGKARVLHHVLIHPHHSEERSDPDFTVSHRVSTEPALFLNAVSQELESSDTTSTCSSELSSLVALGQMLGRQMPSIIQNASCRIISSHSDSEKCTVTLTEPQVILAITEAMNELNIRTPLFLSNSMPVRDAECFLYPEVAHALDSVGVNRGASGIDGIISTVVGYAEANDRHTALLIGDLAALHDINSFHSLSKSLSLSQKQVPFVTTVVVNNDGGGIFSFLPIAKYDNDVNFEEFFGTPTNSFSFKKGAEAFGIAFDSTSSFKRFKAMFKASLINEQSQIVEAKVVERQVNVEVHNEIARHVNEFVSSIAEKAIETEDVPMNETLKVFTRNDVVSQGANTTKILLLLHGWMGGKNDWNEAGIQLAQALPSDWSVVAIDLEGHENTGSVNIGNRNILHSLGLGQSESGIADRLKEHDGTSIDKLAISVMKTLFTDYGIEKITAVAGYSLGGRVALAMNRLCLSDREYVGPKLLDRGSRFILLGSYPGLLPETKGKTVSDSLRNISDEKKKRMPVDRTLADEIRIIANRADLLGTNSSARLEIWNGILDSWYSNPIWGDIKSRQPDLYRKMLWKRAQALAFGARDLATILEECAPGTYSDSDWKLVNPRNTLFLAGKLDTKYAMLGRKWKELESELHFALVPNAGHALLIEAPSFVAEKISRFVLGEEKDSPKVALQVDGIIDLQQAENVLAQVGDHSIPPADAMAIVTGPSSPDADVFAGQHPAALDFESFTIDMTSQDRKEKGVLGIGWGDQASTVLQQRKGFVLQLTSRDGAIVGVGEVSPLSGVHRESLRDAQDELELLKTRMGHANVVPPIDPISILSLEGGLKVYVIAFLEAVGAESQCPSVRAGLEMALISFAAQVLRKPVLKCLSQYSARKESTITFLPLNGLITRKPSLDILPLPSSETEHAIRYSSLKVKVGHQRKEIDVAALTLALQETDTLRPDANRAWTESEALQFAISLEGLNLNVIDRIQFVEEPVRKAEGSWSLRRQLEILERWHQQSGIKYGLDESIADLVGQHQGDFDAIKNDIFEVFEGVTGCAAFVLKPALLGMELSIRLSRLAHNELGIGVVFSSSFDSGVGLAYTAFLAAASDLASGLPQRELLAHGISTFSLLEGDTISPSFASYVNSQGMLQVASLSRALSGYGLDEMRGSFPAQLPDQELSSKGNAYRAATATSSSGREISVVVSLPLPFSDDDACARFADLPQQSRWSPWLRSVAYLDAGRETEWTLNVRGVKFSWRAVSNTLREPYKGLQWRSISGLKNVGIVEFVPDSPNSCIMKLRMTIVPPRVLATLFPGASVFLEDFLQNKLLKWSLEMFRDVVKGDLARERGDVELGDALFGSVEGKANAIEATLSTRSLSGKTGGVD